MATSLLRQDIFDLVNQTQATAPIRPRAPYFSADERDAMAAAGMSSLRRGYEAGRLGVDANAAFADEAGLRAEGRVAAADEARAAALAAQRRAGIYSPAVSQVEQINGVGDGLSWFAGQVGQGAASMQDPLLAGAAINALGTGLSVLPSTRAVGAGLRNFVAPAVGYGINARQLKGEHYGNLSEDPTVVAQYTPQELNDQANTYGMLAGAADSVLPAVVARQLGGGALLAKGRGRLTPMGKVGLGVLGEGVTEVGQGEGSRYLHGELNPLRDTAGDASARLNEFAGGMAGGAGPALAGGAAEGLLGTARRLPDISREAAGTLTDLAKDGVAKATGAVREKAVDLGETLKAASQDKSDAKLTDLNLLRGLPDDPAVADDVDAFRDWLRENAPKRAARVSEGLTGLAQKGDQKASELMQGLDTDAGVEAGAEHLIEAEGLAELAAEADAALDGPQRGLAGRLGAAAGKVGRRAGEVALDGAKGLWDGLGRKRNQQWTGDAYEGQKHQAMRAFDEAGEVAQAKKRSLERAKLMGEYLQLQADAQKPRFLAHRVDGEKVKGLMGQIGEELSSIADSWGLTGRQAIDEDKRGARFDNLKLDLSHTASMLRLAYGPESTRVVQSLRKMAEPGAAPIFDYLDSELEAQSKPGAGSHTAAMKRDAATALVGLVDPETQRKLQAQGIDLTSPGAGRELVSQVRRAVRGSDAAIKSLDQVFGKEITNRMLETMGMTPDQRELEDAYADHQGDSGLVRTSDDVVEAEDTGDFEKRSAEKTYDKSSSTRLYGFYGTPRARTDLAGRDPLAGERGSDGKTRRPRLLELEDTEAVAKRTAALEKQLGNDASWTLTPKSALQAMADHEGIALQTVLGGRLGRNELTENESQARDVDSEGLGVNPAFINKLLARYRDYMRQEADRNTEHADREAAFKKRLNVTNNVLLDRMDQAEGKAPSRTTAGQRARELEHAIRYLSTRGMVVAERGTNRDPQQISTEEVLEMSERGAKLFNNREAGSDKANVLQFESKLANSKTPDTPGPLYLKASDVVRFAKNARSKTAGGEDRSASVNANEQYLRDLSDGIAALVSSGLVEGLPKGFGENSMPDGLPLKTTTYGQYQRAKAKRVEERRKSMAAQEVESERSRDRRTSTPYQEKVAAEQDQDFFVADTDTPDRTDEDEFTSQRVLSRATGADARTLPDETKQRMFPRMQMHSRGPKLGEQLRNMFEGAFDEGLAQAQRYLRQAKTEPQYLAPVLHALDGDAYEGLGITPSEKVAVKALRGEAARELLTAKLSNADRVALARLLAKADGRAKVTAQNVKAFLERAAATAGAPIPTPEVRPPTTKREQDAVSTAAVAAAKEDAAPVGKTSRPSGAGPADFSPARKRNAMATQLHKELGRQGFGATHDSPHKHEGVFDWRKHLGKGEGAWVYGAGTYLSTSDQVHRYYKKAFSGPTYQVSVDAPSERILDWNAPLDEQPAGIRLRALKAIKAHGIDGDLTLTGEDLYRELAEKLGDMPKASDYLQSLGIIGHKYGRSKASRAEPNYVIYDDSKITTNFVAFNKQDPGGAGKVTPEIEKAVREYIDKVLGPQIQVAFKDLNGYSGEWIEAQNVVEIATAAGPYALSIAHHEALHAFFSKYVESDPRVKEAMVALADNPKVLERLKALLADHPNALADLQYGEERLAYTYQFWAADLLDLPGKATTLFEKVHRFFRRVFGMITDEERASTILQALHEGKLREPGAAGQVIAKAMAEGTNARKLARRADAALVKLRGFAYAAHGVLATSESFTARRIATMFWTNPGEGKHGGFEEGYINAKEAAAIKYKNRLNDIVSGLSDRDLRDVAKILQSTNHDEDIADVLAKISYEPHRKAVQEINALLKRFHKYMTEERGADVGKLDNYFPRTWVVGRLLEKQDAFINMLLTKYDKVLADGAQASGLSKEAVAQRIFAKLVDNGSAEHLMPAREDGVLAPFFANSMVRELKWLANEDAEPYLSKDLIGTLTGYFHMGARNAEYAHRFGQRGQKLDAMLKASEGELKAAAAELVKKGELKPDSAKAWVSRRMVQLHKTVGAMEGTLGSDIGSTWRAVNTWATVYQNVRLLPLTLFSSLVDPMGLVARGATMREAYDTFLRGAKEVGASWRDMVSKEPKARQKDAWEAVAEYVGAVDAATFSHHVADEYSSVYMSRTAKRINDTFFRLNGMEAWNRGVRVGATQAAVRFLERHAKLPDPIHSARWLKELGLTPADMTFADDGSLITHKVELAAKLGISKEEAELKMEKVHYAIRRWVQGAVLTPNAAQRPAWSSDPHYSMAFHLKQFSYSFHQTLMKRAVNELEHGNVAPMASFAWYVPVMIGSNIMRGLIQGGGELPTHMKGMDMGDHVGKAVLQTVAGVGTIGIDATHDLSSLAGPMVEQVIDAFGQPVGRTVVDALPAKTLYAEALR